MRRALLVSRALVVGALALLVPACGSGRDEDRTRNTAEAARVQDALAAVPGVAEVDVDWLRDASTPATVDVDVLLEPGADPAAVVDAATRAVWLSRLDPLVVLDVEAYDPAAPATGVTRSLVVADARADLDRRFGARPVG